MDACLEALANSVLDCTQSLTVRSLCATANANISIAKEACDTFVHKSIQCEAVEPVYVVLKKGSDKEADPRTRVISLSYTKSKHETQIHKEIYAINAHGTSTAEEVIRQKLLSNALLTDECRVRTQLFSEFDFKTIQCNLDSYLSSHITFHAVLRGKNEKNDLKSCIEQANSIDQKELAKSQVSKVVAKQKSNKKSKLESENKPMSSRHIEDRVETRKQHATPKVLSIDSSSDDDNDEVPSFVRRNKAISISDDDERANKVRKVDAKYGKGKKKMLHSTTNKEKDNEPENEKNIEDQVAEEPIRKRQYVVSKTRITEEGYMITESNIEEVDIPSDEGSAEAPRVQQSRSSTRPQKETKRKKSSVSQPTIQKSLLSFFKKG